MRDGAAVLKGWTGKIGGLTGGFVAAGGAEVAVDEVNGLYIEPGAASGAGAAVGKHPAPEDYEGYGDGRDGDVEVEVGEAALGDKGRRSGNREGGNRLIEGRHTLRTAAPAVSPEEEIRDENNDKRPNTQARDPER